jgi:hypothetical protein
MPEVDLKEECSRLLCGHLRSMVSRMRQVPEDLWDWTPDPAAPTTRLLAAHAWQWLVCDRQHIMEPDVTKHRFVPVPPTDPHAMCDAIDVEIENWREMLSQLSPEDLAQPRSQFNKGDLNVAWFISHSLRNCIYKLGQFSTLYFALGLDGTDPYEAPFPNRFYEPLLERTVE